jgi:hypothetical protein
MRLRGQACTAMLLVAISGTLPVPEPAQAQQTDVPDVRTIVACMLSNTTNDHKTIFAKLVIAFYEKNEAEAKEQLYAAERAVRDLGLNKCSMNPQLVGTVQFDVIFQTYGNRLYQTIAREASAKVK